MTETASTIAVATARLLHVAASAGNKVNLEALALCVASQGLADDARNRKNTNNRASLFAGATVAGHTELVSH
jgi:hypothetical protein